MFSRPHGGLKEGLPRQIKLLNLGRSTFNKTLSSPRMVLVKVYIAIG